MSSLNKPSLNGIEIRAVKPEEAAAWSRMLAHVFMGDHAPQYESFFEPWAWGAHPLTLAAFAEGKMIAGCGGVIVPEHKMAGFFGAATLPEYRGRGIQAAFMQERLRTYAGSGMRSGSNSDHARNYLTAQRRTRRVSGLLTPRWW